MKKRVHQIITISKQKGTVSWWFDAFLITLISLNVLAIVLESVESIRQPYQDFFDRFEYFSVVVFTIEYVLRVWSANVDERFQKPFIGNLKFMFTPLALIDFFSILPAFLPLIGLDLRLLRVLRLFRLFRMFKIVRYIAALQAINDVFREKREELGISVMFTLFMLLISSTLMFYVENSAQPGNFSSIPETMWWGIATLTTVGYGDVYPITALGKLLGGVIAVFGIGLFALPTGILASGFSMHVFKQKNKEIKCPHCGKEIDLLTTVAKE